MKIVKDKTRLRPGEIDREFLYDILKLIGCGLLIVAIIYGFIFTYLAWTT